jgi:hypothetical protein
MVLTSRFGWVDVNNHVMQPTRLWYTVGQQVPGRLWHMVNTQSRLLVWSLDSICPVQLILKEKGMDKAGLG